VGNSALLEFGSDHTPQRVGVKPCNIHRHRCAHLRGADGFADHDAPYRIVGRPADAVDETGECQVPHGEQMQVCQGRKRQRRDHHAEDNDDERGASLHPFRDGAEECAEQSHRQQP
jgi:hypothetical protein